VESTASGDDRAAGDGVDAGGAALSWTGPQAATAAIIKNAATRAFRAVHNFSRARAVVRGVRVSLLSCASLTKTYASGGRELTVLSNITFAVEAGAFVAILGPSGSGKSTLLGLLAGLDRPTHGAVHLDGVALGELSEDQRARVRGEKVGFVFQSFHLIPTLTALENVQVPLELRGQPARARAQELLGRVGLGERGHHYPAQLSGGEQQRVALARAFSHGPRIVFADEPTGNLDAATGATVIDLLAEMNRALGTTLVLVTHDPQLAARARRIVRLADGAVVADTGEGSP
jgi:putative ABC transport system ATP-binding protein